MKKQLKIVITMLCFLSSFCAHSSGPASMSSGMLDLCKKSAEEWLNIPGKLIKEYPRTAFYSAVAFPVIAHSLYNKTSIIETVKNDLGLNEFSGQPKQTRSYKFLTDIPQDLWTACRLYAYQSFSYLLPYLALSSLVNLSNLPPQFDVPPSFTYAVILAPIIEEINFTYGWSNMIKQEHNLLAASIVTPILFGVAHYHDDPRMWALVAYHAAIGSFLRVRNYHASDHNTLAPIFSHMLNNAVVEAIEWSSS